MRILLGLLLVVAVMVFGYFGYSGYGLYQSAKPFSNALLSDDLESAYEQMAPVFRNRVRSEHFEKYLSHKDLGKLNKIRLTSFWPWGNIAHIRGEAYDPRDGIVPLQLSAVKSGNAWQIAAISTTFGPEDDSALYLHVPDKFLTAKVFFSESPGISTDGELLLSGNIPVDGQNYPFRLSYVPEDDDWYLLTIILK